MPCWQLIWAVDTVAEPRSVIGAPVSLNSRHLSGTLLPALTRFRTPALSTGREKPTKSYRWMRGDEASIDVETPLLTSVSSPSPPETAVTTNDPSFASETVVCSPAPTSNELSSESTVLTGGDSSATRAVIDPQTTSTLLPGSSATAPHGTPETGLLRVIVTSSRPDPDTVTRTPSGSGRSVTVTVYPAGTGPIVPAVVPPSRKVPVPVSIASSIPSASTSTGPALKTESTGVKLSSCVPSPSCPEALEPQHLTPPPIRAAQEWNEPVVTAATPLERPKTSTGVRGLTVVPSPSCPTVLAPQHFTPPVLVTAQVCLEDDLAAMAATPLVSPETSTGVVLPLVVPLPTMPTLPSPPHH